MDEAFASIIVGVESAEINEINFSGYLNEQVQQKQGIDTTIN